MTAVQDQFFPFTAAETMRKQKLNSTYDSIIADAVLALAETNVLGRRSDNDRVLIMAVQQRAMQKVTGTGNPRLRKGKRFYGL